MAECERATRVRGRYLSALEDERFELLPEPAYARGFLRTYAQFLGLDPEPLLEELRERLGDPGEAGALPTVHAAPRTPRAPRPPPAAARVPLLLAGGVAVVAGIVWLGGRDDPGRAPLLPARSVPSTTAPVTTGTPRPVPAPRTTSVPSRTPVPPAAPALVLLGLPPAGGWVQVRRATPTGPVLFEGTLATGARRRFPLTTPLWMRVGWSAGVRVSAAGRVRPLPAGTVEVTVGRDGTVR